MPYGDLQLAIDYGANKAIVKQLLNRGITSFTKSQEEAIVAGLCSGKSLIISAPTSAGKTTIAEIAAAEAAFSGKKTVYLVTHRALAEEKYQLFKSEYDSAGAKWFDVSIATGDHTEGQWKTGILIATYEKFLSLLSASTSLSVDNKVIVADEMQIIAEKSRGPDVEILCTIIKNSSPAQFIGLTATTPNVAEVADWLGCGHVTVTDRDVPLRQEIRHENSIYSIYHGSDFGSEATTTTGTDTIEVINELVVKGETPILVFTMTKPRASELAEQFSNSRAQHPGIFSMIKQLDLFCEKSQLLSRLKGTAAKKVAFHTADLAFSERAIVEDGLRNKAFDVVFATPTLASGVNFPIRSVIFDSFNRFWLSDPWLPKQEYLNMSGRAGRLGAHDEGTAILIARNIIEQQKAQEYVSPQLDPINSSILKVGLRKQTLRLISCEICKSLSDLNSFFESTFWWHQTEDKNLDLVARFKERLDDGLQWLEDNGLIIKNGNDVCATRLGKSISSTGLLPSSGVALTNILRAIHDSNDFDNLTSALIHAICSCDEFKEGVGQRFLPYERNNRPEAQAWNFVTSDSLFYDPDTVHNPARVANATFAITHWINGLPEHALRMQMPPISYGQFHTLSADISWIMDGLATISNTPGLGLSELIGTDLLLLSERVKFGVPVEALDIIKAAKEAKVPGFARERAMILFEHSLAEPNILVSTEISELSSLLDDQSRAESLKNAIYKHFSGPMSYWKQKHEERAEMLGIDKELIANSYEWLGDDYEIPIEDLLSIPEWKVEKIDVGNAQGVPDFAVSHNGMLLLLECKTKKKITVTVETADAFAIFTKSADMKYDHLVTLAKPDFGSFSRKKAAGSDKITLVNHVAFVEAVLLHKEGNMSLDDLFSWLLKPGVASIDSLAQWMPQGLK